MVLIFEPVKIDVNSISAIGIKLIEIKNNNFLSFKLTLKIINYYFY